jgi:proton-translocating NADH-quinone oxidoreductase chain N
MIMGSVGSVILLFGMAFIYGMAGTLNLAVLAETIRGAALTPWTIIIFATLIVGFGVKSAIVPMHTWLPDAHPEAPSPISALLSGIVIETGLYAMIRVLYVLYEPALFQLPMAILAFATMTLGNLLALRQDDLKRMLAYSSIAQIGYMLIGVSSGIAYGLMGTFLHVFNHAFMKGTAFLAVGSIDHETGTRDINKLKGVGRKMPFTTFSILIAFLGLAGVPGTSGFISKFVLFSSSIGVGYILLAIFGVLNSTLSVAYYARVIMALLGEAPEDAVDAKEAPPLMVTVTLVMALVVLVFGLFPETMTNYATLASDALVEGLSEYIGAILS